MYFPIAGIFFSILLVIVYFSKRKIKTFETDIYGILIITNLVGLISEILCTYAAIIYDEHQLIADFILKLYLEYITTFSYFYTIYIISLSKTDNAVTKRKNIFIKILSVIFALSSTIVTDTFESSGVFSTLKFRTAIVPLFFPSPVNEICNVPSSEISQLNSVSAIASPL